MPHFIGRTQYSLCYYSSSVEAYANNLLLAEYFVWDNKFELQYKNQIEPLSRYTYITSFIVSVITLYHVEGSIYFNSDIHIFRGFLHTENESQIQGNIIWLQEQCMFNGISVSFCLKAVVLTKMLTDRECYRQRNRKKCYVWGEPAPFTNTDQLWSHHG